MNNFLTEIKNLLKIEIDDKTLTNILFDINRYFDKDLTSAFKSEQKKTGRIFNSVERKSLRNYFYHGEESDLKENNLEYFPRAIFDKNDIKTVCENTLQRLTDYDPDKILNSIKQRFSNLVIHRRSSISYKDEWLNYYNEKRARLFDYSTFILRISNDDFKKHNYQENYIFELIASTYCKLENYRHLILVFDGQIYDACNNDITWKLIYKSTLYAEGFINYNDKFFPFKQDKQIKLLRDFISARLSCDNANALASDFYSSISTGYKFEDCFIEEEQNIVIISLKKITRDESLVPCPSCMKTIEAGNSYPELFLRSYECKNPDCQDRSKSGRGKRFDEYGVYRSFKLEENNPENKISNSLYNIWRRDIFPKNSDWLEMILKYYTWDKEKVLIYNVSCCNSEKHSRSLIAYNESFSSALTNYAKSFADLKIVNLFVNLHKQLDKTTGNVVLEKPIEIFNEDSSSGIKNLSSAQIGTAITSPPYYNAREYSQWSNMILYYVDMLINASAVYQSISNEGHYLYNIGDIVCEDNVYVESHMSNRRLPLGFLSCLIFEIAGFNLSENIIWDKGQVQSKRNSTVNLFSGYVKCINCYEHVFVFSKNTTHSNTKTVAAINPVIKINSKGENTYKHTAPYPIELVSLIKPYLQKDKYVLDPFLGSGTTLKWCRKNKLKGVGFELSKEYYELAIDKIFNE